MTKKNEFVEKIKQQANQMPTQILNLRIHFFSHKNECCHKNRNKLSFVENNCVLASDELIINYFLFKQKPNKTSLLSAFYHVKQRQN